MKTTPTLSNEQPTSLENPSDKKLASEGIQHDESWDSFLSDISAPSTIGTGDRSGLDALPARYPRIFNGDPMPWGFQVGAGWTHLITVLCARIDGLLQQAPGAHIQMSQVKEKFGTLRFYYQLRNAPSGVAEAISQSVCQAEQASSICCERCGARAELRQIRWCMTTLCARCESEQRLD